MLRHILQSLRGRMDRAWRAMPGLWKEAAPELPEAAAGLQLPLLPSRMVRRGGWLLLAAQGVYLAQLIYLGHLLVATLVVALGAAFAWNLRRAAGTTRSARRLLLAADGRLHLLDPGGRLLPVRLHPASMRLGPWLLLVLVTGTGPQRLLLGPDNVDPGRLAALRRRVAAMPHRLGGTR